MIDFVYGTEPNRGIITDKAVTCGAAVRAGILSGFRDLTASDCTKSSNHINNSSFCYFVNEHAYGSLRNCIKSHG